MKPRTKRFAIALLAFSALTGAAQADQASEALVRGWIESLDKSPDWTAKAASISSQGPATIVAGLAIAREDGSVSLTGEELRFDELAAGSGGGFSTSAVAAKNLAMGGKPWNLSIPKLEAKGFVAPSLGNWSFDPKTPVTSVARLYTIIAKTRLDLFSIPEASLHQEIAIPGAPAPAKSTGRYVDVRYEGLADGKLKLQSVGKIETSSESAGPGMPAMSFAIEGMSARNMDLAAFAHVIDPDSYAGDKGDGKWITAVEGGTYGKITVKSDNKDAVTVADISFGEMSVRQTEKPFVGAIDELLALGPNPDEAKVFDVLSGSLPAFVGWFKIASLTMTDFKATGPDGGKASLAKASIADLSPDGMKRFAFEGFDAQGPGGKVGLKLLEIADVIWPSLALYVDVGRFAAKQEKGEPLDSALAGKIAGSFFNLFPKVGRLAIEGVTVEGFGPEPLSLESITATGVYDGSGIASDSRTELKKLVVPGALLRMSPEAAQFFDALGYDRLVIGGRGNEIYDRTIGAYSSQSRLGVDDAGALAMYFALGGLTPERLKTIMLPIITTRSGADPDPAALIAAADGVTLNGFSLRFEDASLTKRLLAYAAKMQNMDEQTMVANTTALMQIGMSQLQNPEFTQKAVDAVKFFLQDPKSITFSMKPPSPVTVQQVMGLNPADPAAAIKLFGFSIAAND